MRGEKLYEVVPHCLWQCRKAGVGVAQAHHARTHRAVPLIAFNHSWLPANTQIEVDRHIGGMDSGRRKVPVHGIQSVDTLSRRLRLPLV